ncbi:MAG: LytTR family transcriptional regulator [Actinomycetota bacterium]|nr:LytTR family transcriptional regulator [Actinomycetota bacterium]
MSQGEMSASPEANEDDDSIAVWPLIGPKHSKTSGMDRGQARVVLAPSQVSWVEIKGHLMELYTATGENYVLRGTLKSLQQWWAKHNFVRIHNSYLVSLAHVRKLRATPRGGWKVYLTFGAEQLALPISRRRLSEFKQLWTDHVEAQYEKSFY